MALVRRKMLHVLGALTLGSALWQGPMLHKAPVAYASNVNAAAVKSEPTNKGAMKQKKSAMPGLLF